jgi:pyruvate kinase
MRKTKIICTLGPATDDENVLRSFLRADGCGPPHFSHGSHEDHLKRITLLKGTGDESGRPVALLLDTRGPEIRIRKFAKGPRLKDGDIFLLTTEDVRATRAGCR